MCVCLCLPTICPLTVSLSLGPSLFRSSLWSAEKKQTRHIESASASIYNDEHTQVLSYLAFFLCMIQKGHTEVNSNNCNMKRSTSKCAFKLLKYKTAYSAKHHCSFILHVKRLRFGDTKYHKFWTQHVLAAVLLFLDK